MSVICQYCGGSDWYEGPSGGLNTNILCANPNCRHWFNDTPAGLDDLNRIEPTDEEKVAAREARKTEAEKAREARFEEGRRAFRAGKSPQMLRTNPSYGGYAEPAPNIDRLVGFLEEILEEVAESHRR